MSDQRPTDGRRFITTTAMGVTQILAWGSSFYLPAVLAPAIAQESGWSMSWVIGGLSCGLLTSGLSSPMVGRTIQRIGGRPVLAISSLLLAIALALLGTATSYPAYLVAWIIMGLGMSCGLYDAAFATVGRLYGRDARSVITTLTLWGGFASTVCWPLSAFLVDAVGWRDACLVYACMHIVLGLPLHLFAVPRASRVLPPSGGAVAPVSVSNQRHETGTFLLLAGILTCAALISSMLSVHLLTVLQLRGLDLATAVALGALIGPAQVAARVIDMVLGRRYHPAWTMVASVALVTAGLFLLLLDAPLPALALLLYGAGNGIHTIARGALPLVLFSPDRYALFMGRLAFPSLIMQASAPWIGASLLSGNGSMMLAVLTLAALANLTLAIWLLLRRASGT